MKILCCECEFDMDSWTKGQMWLTSIHFPTTGLNFLFSFFTCFSVQPFKPSAASHLHLPSWWYSSVLVATEQSSRDSVTHLHLPLTDIFTFKVLPSCFCSNMLGWKHCAGQKLKKGHVCMSSLSWPCSLFIIMQRKRERGLNEDVAQAFNTWTTQKFR